MFVWTGLLMIKLLSNSVRSSRNLMRIRQHIAKNTIPNFMKIRQPVYLLIPGHLTGPELLISSGLKHFLKCFKNWLTVRVSLKSEIAFPKLAQLKYLLIYSAQIIVSAVRNSSLRHEIYIKVLGLVERFMLFVHGNGVSIIFVINCKKLYLTVL